MALSNLLDVLARLFGLNPAPAVCVPMLSNAVPLSGTTDPVSAPHGTEIAPPVSKNVPAETVGETWLELCRPMTEHFESCRLVAYPDPATGAEPWTCGWGATGPDVVCGTVWTQEHADSRLTIDLGARADQVDVLVTVPLTAARKAALVDFVYNVGVGNFRSSTMLRLLNAGNYQGAADQFPRWNVAAGKVLDGLVKRRRAERDLFLTGTWSPT